MALDEEYTVAERFEYLIRSMSDASQREWQAVRGAADRAIRRAIKRKEADPIWPSAIALKLPKSYRLLPDDWKEVVALVMHNRKVQALHATVYREELRERKRQARNTYMRQYMKIYRDRQRAARTG